MQSHCLGEDLAAEATMRYRSEWTTAGRLVEERAAWRELCDVAVEPNPLYAPNVLIAMERHLRGGRAIPVLVVRDSARNGALAGLAPIEARGWWNGFPGRAVSLFVNPYVPLTHPLIRRDDAAAILDEMLRALACKAHGFLVLPFLAEKRGFAALLREAASRGGCALSRVDGWTRPAVEPEPGACGEYYASVYLGKNFRSGNSRRMRRLADIGTVAFTEVLTDEAGGDAALTAFLELESAGWKGAAATALNSKESTRAFAIDAFNGMDRAPRVRLRALTLDQRPIAMALDLESQGVAYAFKAAYHPDFARHAPGLMLDAHTASRIGAGFDVERLDSLAQSEIAQAGIWRQQEPIGRYILALTAQKPQAEALARRLRGKSAAARQVREYARRGREIAALARDPRIAFALIFIGIGVPLVSLFGRSLG
jgi:CelD/BcsL family acetyltransferase involved in cellulose biosynthesis